MQRSEDWSVMVHFLGVSEDLSDIVWNQLQLSNGLFSEICKDVVTIVKPTKDKCMDTFFPSPAET